MGRRGEGVHLFKKVVAAVRADRWKSVGGGGGRGGGAERFEEDTHVTFMAPVSLVVDGGGVGSSGDGGCSVVAGGGWRY